MRRRRQGGRARIASRCRHGLACLMNGRRDRAGSRPRVSGQLDLDFAEPVDMAMHDAGTLDPMGADIGAGRNASIPVRS